MLQAFGDVVIGSVLGPSSQRANECRIAMFLAGYPQTVPVRTVNRYDVVLVVGHSLGYPRLVVHTVFCFTTLFYGLLADLAGMHHVSCMGMHSGNASVDIALQCGCGHQPESMFRPVFGFS